MAKSLRHRLSGRGSRPFRYRDWGTMATIGRNEAAADFGFFRLKGWLAWMTWGLVHIYCLTGFRNLIVVFLAWVWTYVTFGIGAQIIISNSVKD